MPLEENTYDEIPSGRVDTLVQAIERIERLEKQLKIADSYLQVIVGLKGGKCFQCVDFARRARKKIKELDDEKTI